MAASKLGRKETVGVIAKAGVVLIVLGALSFCLEHFGVRYMSRVSAFVAEQGALAPVVFMAANGLASMLLVPQSLFSVLAGVLFGWKFGTLYACCAMTGGAICSFLLARYGVRDWLRQRYAAHPVFQKMEQLSRTHPFHVIALSRIIPVIPFPAASYLLGITRVRAVPFALLTWLCMLPETLFLASGGHLLLSGIVHGKAPWEVVGVLVVAGGVLAVVVHRMKKKFLEDTDEV